jgi:peptidylprolyl isomerase
MKISVPGPATRGAVTTPARYGGQRHDVRGVHDMSDGVAGRERSRPAHGPRTGAAKARGPSNIPSKAERRAAFKAARVAAARRRRRWRIAGWIGGGVLAAALLVAGFLLLTGGDEPTAPAAAPPCGDSGPPVPAGADPALCTKPVVGPGTGELTELKVTTLVAGTGPALATGQQVTVNYVGVSYTSGEEFDASWKNSRPYTFPFGAGRVIDGWDQGLAGVTVGSRVQLDIPAELAYGDSGQGGPAGPLRFVVDVLAAS